jgi:Rps23 Pro-64 3,4-dihydroxylase Tpa1-like proline 4-hydroxylase
MPSPPAPEAAFSDARQNLKMSYSPDELPRYSRSLFHFFDSRPLIAFLQEMAGIDELVPDPYYMGAGIHRTDHGGHLDIHADFNVHKVMKLERRLNVLIYLNRDWRPEWGGAFEIWDKAMERKVSSYLPIFDRMVCFSTGSDTFHGAPEKIASDGTPRLSIALYYYTATWDASRKGHSTLFEPRPGTEDERNRRMDRQEAARDFVPPVLFRRISGPLKRLGVF